MSENKEKTTRDQALRVARMLGCQGAHETDAGWMPCASHEEYEGIKKGKEEYLKVRASNNKKPLPKMVQRTKRLETKSDAYYENRADAVAISKARGCGGVRTVMLAGKKYYAICNHKAPKRGWENLDEKPITGIATLPGGGLVTGSFSGKSLGRPIGGVSDFDGDGDGFSTGPDGEDNIPVPKIPKKMFHGSTVKLNVGDYLLPPSETGVKPRAHPDIDANEFNNTNYVYLTSKLEDARGYGSDVVKPGQKIYIYEVEPSDDVEEDPENEIFGVEGGFRSRKAKIKKIVATLTSNSDGSMDEKGFVNFVSRSTDPDTFSDPDSARIRSRNLGCIGIRRYTARDGKLVWLPCSNVSDYNRVTGIRGDNSPRNNPRRQGSGFKKKSETEEKALGRSIGGYRRMFKPIGGVGALEDGDGDGFATGADGEDNIPVAKVPKPKNKKPAPKKKVPKKRLTPQQQRERTRWENQLRRDELAKRKREIEFEIERRKPDVPRLPPGMVSIEKAREVKKHWDDLVDNLFEQAEWGNDEKAQEKKKRKLLAQAYVATARKFKLSPKQVQQHMNEVGRRVYDDLPWVWRPEDLPVRDIMLVRGAKPSQKDALSDGIISFKGVPKPKKKPPTVTSTDINNLAVMVRKNNAKAKTSAKTNLRDLKVVFVRGLSDGGREEANNRVSKFLSLLNSDKPKDVKYSEDNDLLPIDHPWKSRKTAKKWADFEEGEYGVKYAGGCCPKVVKRYRPK